MPGPFKHTICILGRFWLTTLKPNEIKSKFAGSVDILSCVDQILQDFIVEDIIFSPHTIGHIYQFSKKIIQCSTEVVVICTHSTHHALTAAALLLGGYLAVCEHLDAKAIADAFKLLSARFVPFCRGLQHDGEGLAVHDCWAALHRAASKGWLDFSDDPADGSIDMLEHLHYASTANGRLHVVVPDKLLAFPSPCDLPAGCEWADEDGERRFSAGFYADILSDYDASLVVCCAGDLPYPAAALTERGLAVEVLAGDGGSRQLLAVGDRLLTLAGAAPGAMAVHGGGGWEEGVLLAACLIRLHGFRAREALAWTRMTHPAGAVAEPRLALYPAAN